MLPKISWDAVILFGAGVAIAETMNRNETANWLALQITDWIPGINPFGAALFMIIFVLVLRFGFAEMLAITATVLPITISLADTWTKSSLALSSYDHRVFVRIFSTLPINI